MAPTSICKTLYVFVTGSDTQWNGLYAMDEDNPSFNNVDWNGIDSANGEWIKYLESSWVIKGSNDRFLTYKSRDDPDNYPPITVTKQWTDESENDVNVTIACSITYSPTPAPTISPSLAPVMLYDPYICTKKTEK